MIATAPGERRGAGRASSKCKSLMQTDKHPSKNTERPKCWDDLFVINLNSFYGPRATKGIFTISKDSPSHVGGELGILQSRGMNIPMGRFATSRSLSESGVGIVLLLGVCTNPQALARARLWIRFGINTSIGFFTRLRFHVVPLQSLVGFSRESSSE